LATENEQAERHCLSFKGKNQSMRNYHEYGKYIEIKSLDCQGRTNMTGWSLPMAVVDSLSKWLESSKI